MSIESHFASQGKKKPTFRDVAGKLLSEKESTDTRPWKWEEHITEFELKQLRNELKSMNEGGDSFTWVVLNGAMLKLLDPRYAFHFDKEELVKMNEEWLQYRNSKRNTVPDFGRFAASAYLLDRNQFPSISEWDWKIFEKDIRVNWALGVWNNVAYGLVDLKILDPKRPLPLNDIDWKSLCSQLEDDRINDSYYFGVLASHMRLLKPESQIIINDVDWKKMENELNNLANDIPNNMYRYLHLALSMRILAAHNVEITKDGIVITDKILDTLDVGIPPRPTRKKLN